jgi:hypothetical protein
MNPISNLIGKKFNELTASELMQVVAAYCDQNRYDFNDELNYKTRKDVENYFESNFHGLFELKSFFIYWTV